MKGLIYKLNVGSLFYIGSTQSLAKRLAHHKHNSKTKTGKLFDAIRNIGSENISIELIEEGDFDTKKELRFKEREYITQVLIDPSCLNTNQPICSVEEKKKRMRLYSMQRREKERVETPKRVLKKDDPEYHQKRWLEWANKNRDHLRTQYKIQDENRIVVPNPITAG